VQVPHSSVPGVTWPAIASGPAAMLLALLQQLEETQWLTAAELERLQFQQLGQLLAHAWRTVPYYRAVLDTAGYRPGQDVTSAFWHRLPILARRTIQQQPAAFISGDPLPSHGKRFHDRSSGSTGTPVTIVKTDIEHLFWQAFTLREELWHARDRGAKLAVLRAGMRKAAPTASGGLLENWGAPVATVYPSGPMALLDLAITTTAEQAAWLVRENPAYLLTVPSALRELARHFHAHGLALSDLRALRTVGEVVGPELRQECRAAWGVEIADIYSATEVGYIALQCPGREHYHAQAESALVEILDEHGRPCRPGTPGRVVVTPLHNFAMPLLRYEIGDFAEPGEPCACGRGLPVLTRIFGRVREMLVLPSGQRRYPTGWFREFSLVDGLVQFQLVQKSLDALELRLVTRPPFGAGDEERLRQMLQAALGASFTVAFRYLDEIPRGPSGKFFEFVSEVADQ